MLVLTRRLGEGLIIEDNIKITFEKISMSEIKIGIEAQRDVAICREEVLISQDKDCSRVM